MDRRQFLSTVERRRALALARSRRPSRRARRRAAASGDAALNAMFESIFQERVKRIAELATSLGLDKGANAASEVGARRAADGRSARRGDLALARRRPRRAEGHARRRRCRTPRRLNREVVIYQTRNGHHSGRAVRHRQRRSGPIRSSSRTAPISRRPISSTAPTRSRMRPTPRPIFRASPCSATSLDNETREPARAGGARLPRPGLVDRPDARPDAASCARRRPRQSTMVDSHRPAAPRRRTSPATGRRARRRSSPTSVYPALDRQIALMERLQPTSTPGDGAWRVPQGDAIYAAALAAGDDHQFHARRSPPARPRRRSPRSAPSSTRSCAGRRLHHGHGRRAPDRA